MNGPVRVWVLGCVMLVKARIDKVKVEEVKMNYKNAAIMLKFFPCTAKIYKCLIF
jgi:hypothetical protein